MSSASIQFSRFRVTEPDSDRSMVVHAANGHGERPAALGRSAQPCCSASCRSPWPQRHVVKPTVREPREAGRDHLCKTPMGGLEHGDILADVLKDPEPLTTCHWSAHTEPPSNLRVKCRTHPPIGQKENCLCDADARRNAGRRQARKDSPQRGEGFILRRRSLRNRQDAEICQRAKRLCRRFEEIVEKGRLVLGLRSKAAHRQRTGCLPLAEDSPKEFRAGVSVRGNPCVPVVDIPNREVAHIGSDLPWRLVSDRLNRHRCPSTPNYY
jgi:hypothetical protein